MRDFNYKEKYIEQLRFNIAKIVDDIDSKDMEIKISRWADKFGYSYENIYNKIKSDEIFRCIFVKDPAKQNFYENVAFDFIRSMDNVSHLKKGNKFHIIQGKPTRDNRSNSKSVDFIWESIIDGKNCSCYGYHKYTQGSGGAQDNQYKDIQSFIKDCSNTQGKIDESKQYFAICDGSYYTPLKFQELRRLASENTKVFSIFELRDFLKEKLQVK